MRDERLQRESISLFALLLNPYLLCGLMLYLAATVHWIWPLRSAPLNVAYPFMGLVFLIVPLLGSFLLQEPISTKVMLGGLLIMVGIYVANG